MLVEKGAKTAKMDGDAEDQYGDELYGDRDKLSDTDEDIDLDAHALLGQCTQKRRRPL